jgi:RecA/RadA recombinase
MAKKPDKLMFKKPTKKEPLPEASTIREDILNIINREISTMGKKKITSYLPTNILPLDLAFSTKLKIDGDKRFAVPGRGLPSGQPLCIVGAYQSGKSTMLCNFLASAQALGGEAVLFNHEAEGITDSLMDANGVDRDRLILASPLTCEETLEAVETIIKRNVDSSVPIVIGIDSISGMQTMSQEGKTYKDAAQVAHKPLLMERFFARNNPYLSMSRNTFLIFTALAKTELKMGFTGPAAPQDTWHCKNQINQYCSFVLKMKRKEMGKDEDTRVIDYVILEAEFLKNKVSNDVFRKFEVPFYVNPGGLMMGLDDTTACIDYLIEKEVLKKVTSQSFEVDGVSMTRNKIRNKMFQDPDFYKIIRGLVVNHYLTERGFEPVTFDESTEESSGQEVNENNELA